MEMHAQLWKIMWSSVRSQLSCIYCHFSLWLFLNYQALQRNFTFCVLRCFEWSYIFRFYQHGHKRHPSSGRQVMQKYSHFKSWILTYFFGYSAFLADICTILQRFSQLCTGWAIMSAFGHSCTELVNQFNFK